MWRLLSLALLCLGTSLLPADMSNLPLGSTIKDFVLPQRNAQGEMQATITGDTATAASINRTVITGLKIELYEGPKVATVITSPKSELWMQDNRLTSQSGVVVKRGDMTITSKSMEWLIKDQKATMRDQVRVVINQLNFGAAPTKIP